MLFITQGIDFVSVFAIFPIIFWYCFIFYIISRLIIKIW